MKGSKFLIATALSLLFLLQSAGAADMLVQTWDPDMGCEHTMTTNHFDLAPGEKVELAVDLTGCTADQMGMMLYFGYHTTKTRSRPLSSKDKIRLTLVDDQTGEEFVSDSGSVLIDVAQPGRCKLYAENMNRTKTLKIRLRSSAGL
ncbi:MAG: hypothetical protein ACWGPN_08255 [Gammaproteobacteria bacterium]|jgi:hypothetical protein